MASDRAIGQYRRWYARLLRLYPRPFRDRFAEPMAQTFTDLCRERREANEPMFGYVLAAFLNTLGSIIKENLVRSDRPRPVTILATLAAVGGVGGVLGVLAGAFVVHGLASLDATDAIKVIPGLALAALYLAFAYGAWTLTSWAWTLGVVVGVASIVYVTAILVTQWGEFMRDASLLAWMLVLVAVIAAVGLVLWFRPDVKAAFVRP